MVHAGAAITTGLMNLWQENFLAASVPYLFNPFITAQPGSAVPFQNSVAVIPLPPAYDISGNLIFPNGQSTDAKPNTVMDLQRYQDAVAAEAPGHQAQLPALSAVANNFRNGYIASWTLSLEHNFRDFDATVAYVGTAGIHLPCVFYPNSYTGADPAFAPFTRFDAAGKPIGGASTIYVVSSDSHSSYNALRWSPIPKCSQQLAARRMDKLAVALWWRFHLMRQFVAIFSSHGVPNSQLMGTRSI